MMAVINILALIVSVMIMAYITKEKIVDVLPAAVCMLVLILYLLGFAGHLSFIDFISIAVLASSAGWLFRKDRKTRREIGSYIGNAIKEPGTIIIFITILVVAFCVKDKMVTWWDDYNFWATDVKSLFYLDGFAGKYTNVAPEFGDYPPGTQMLKWWFLHFSPSVFREGLMFGGYYCMNLIFMAPLLRYLKGKNILVWILCAMTLWSFPSVAEAFYLDGTCADLTMALIYGAFLVSVLDREGHKEFFYYGRMALYLMVLILTKNVAFIWVAFGLIFALIYTVANKLKVSKWLFLSVAAALTEISWLGFCLLMRRVAKLTGTAFSMAAGGVDLPGYTGELIDSFKEAFLFYPLHRYETVMIDITPLGMCLLVILLFAVLLKQKRMTVRSGVWIGFFMLVSGLLYYGILLVSHLTIFAIEEQYLEPFGMISSIERYGVPFTIGSLYVIGYLFLRTSKSKYGAYLACILFVLLTADHQSAYRGLWGYEKTLAEAESARVGVMDENAEKLLETITRDGLKQGRILYLKDQADVRWIQHAYLGFEAAPVSVVSGYLSADYQNDEMQGRGEVLTAIDQSHAGYIYVNQLGPKRKESFAGMTVDSEFCYQQLYRIDESGGEIRLTAVNGVD